MKAPGFVFLAASFVAASAAGFGYLSAGDGVPAEPTPISESMHRGEHGGASAAVVRVEFLGGGDLRVVSKAQVRLSRREPDLPYRRVVKIYTSGSCCGSKPGEKSPQLLLGEYVGGSDVIESGGYLLALHEQEIEFPAEKAAELGLKTVMVSVEYQAKDDLEALDADGFPGWRVFAGHSAHVRLPAGG